MKKKEVFERLLVSVTDMLKGATEGQKEAQDEANMHIGAMISRYDTFKEEAQYLAGAQLRRVAELTEAKNLLEALIGNPPVFEPSNKVRVASLVTIADEDGNRITYLLSPALGGEKLEVEGETATVLSLTSPIGQQLRGKEVDEEVNIKLQGKDLTFFVESIK